ncbi:MAG: hypothetical protein ACM3WT_07690, partial [Bacillota bacterium]
KSDPNSTGWAAFFLSLPIYIIPFSFVFAPQLLLVGTAAQVLQSVVFGVAACTAVTIGTSGYFRDRMSPIERGLAVASGVAILLHQWWSPIALVCAGIVLARNWFIAVKKAKAIQA